MAKEDHELQKAKLLARLYKQLSTDYPLEFNSFIITLLDDKL